MKFHRNKNEEKEKENKSTKGKMLSKDYINKLTGKELNELMKEYMEDIFPKEKDNKNIIESLREKEEDNKKEDNENDVKYMYIPTIKLIINTNSLLKNIYLKENEKNREFPDKLLNLNSDFSIKNSLSSNINLSNLNSYKNSKKSKDFEILVLAYNSDEKNSRIIFTGGSDTFIHLWDIELGLHVDTWKNHKRSVITMTFDGLYLLSGGEDGIINVWNTFDRSLLFSLKDNINDIPMKIQDQFLEISN